MVEKTSTQAHPPTHRVVLAGYYGFGNLGDEVLLEVMLRWLRQFPGVAPCVLSGDPEHTRRHYGVRAVARLGVGAFAKSFLGAKALVFGGGGILQDATSRRSLLYYTGLIRMAQALGVPVMMLGQGLGPLSARGQSRVSEALRRVSYISVRDRQSFDMLRGWGVAKRHLGADLAFCLPTPPEPEEGAKPLLGLALVPPPEAQREAVLQRVSNAVTEVCEAFELSPIFLAGNRRDLGFGVALSQRLPQLTVLPIGQDAPEKHLALLSGFNVIWGSRMHVLALAAVAGVPFVGLSYDPKVDHLISQLNQHLVQPLDSWPLSQAQPADLAKATGRLLKGFHRSRQELRQAAALQREKAQAALADAGHHLCGLLGLQGERESTTLK